MLLKGALSSVAGAGVAMLGLAISLALFGLWAGGISYRKECDDQGVIKKGPRSFLIAVLFTFGLLGATMGCGGQSQTQAQKQHAAEVEQHKRAGNAAIDRFN